MMFRNCVEARAYMFNVMASVIDNELTDDQKDGWMFGGVDNEFDRRRLTNELKKYKAFVLKRASKLKAA